jgi:hypothetical protein
MNGRGGQRGTHVSGFCRVHDGVVNQDDVKLTPEAQGSHICLKVFAVGINLPANRKHPWRAIRQRERKVRPEVRRQTAPAGAEFEESLRLCR